MIHGIGVDMVRISRIEAALAKFGNRFAQRILTDAEFRTFAASRRRADFLAKHFAAKEALAKALGTGFRDGISCRHIEVRSNPLGKPYLVCTGPVSERFDEHQIGASFLSLCDEDEYALAFVTLLTR